MNTALGIRFENSTLMAEDKIKGCGENS